MYLATFPPERFPVSASLVSSVAGKIFTSVDVGRFVLFLSPCFVRPACRSVP